MSGRAGGVKICEDMLIGMLFFQATFPTRIGSRQRYIEAPQHLNAHVSLDTGFKMNAFTASAGALLASRFRVLAATIDAVVGIALPAAIPAFLIAGIEFALRVFIDRVEKKILVADFHAHFCYLHI